VDRSAWNGERKARLSARRLSGITFFTEKSV